MLRRPTSAWTDQHTRVAGAFAVGLAGCLVGLGESGSEPFWVASAVAGTAVASLAFDAFGGIVAGLAAAAALIAARRIAGTWDADAFALSLAETLVLILAGATSGLAGAALRRPADGEEAASTVLAPVFGSLGLLPHDIAMLRLEEEVERARAHRRPLTLVIVRSEIADQSLDADARKQALRAVARILESRLHERDVPFAISPERLGAILPEATAADGWARVGAVVAAIADASFMSRATGTRSPVADAVHLNVGLAELVGPGKFSADALLDAAIADLGQHLEAREPEPT